MDTHCGSLPRDLLTHQKHRADSAWPCPRGRRAESLGRARRHGPPHCRDFSAPSRRRKARVQGPAAAVEPATPTVTALATLSWLAPQRKLPVENTGRKPETC